MSKHKQSNSIALLPRKTFPSLYLMILTDIPLSCGFHPLSLPEPVLLFILSVSRSDCCQGWDKGEDIVPFLEITTSVHRIYEGLCNSFQSLAPSYIMFKSHNTSVTSII